jgi:hypothetical protein
MEYEQKIPKVIWQTMKTDTVPVLMKNYIDTWITQNPEYEYRLYDDDDILNFLTNDFPQFLEGYKKLKFGASKADLWRYLIIYKYGGVYADLDCICNKPLREWIDPAALFVTQLGINRDLCQWLIISVPGNPLFLKAAERSLENILKKNYKVSHYGFKYSNNKVSISDDSTLLNFNHEVLGLAGPPVLQKAAEECYKNGLLDKILANIQIVCVSSPSTSCQMDGNVSHGSGGNKDYKSGLKLLNVPHYNRVTKRLSRKIASILKRFKQKR